MNFEISGDLENTRCTEIVKILSLGKRTGRLALSYGAENGSIYFQEGQITHAACGSAEGVKAIYEISVWNSGEYRFFVDDLPDFITIDQSVDEIIAETENRIRQMDRISSLIPSANAVFALDPDVKEKDIQLKSIQWRVITKINGKNSIADIAREVGLTDSDAMKVFYSVVKQGLIKEIEVQDIPQSSGGGMLPETPFALKLNADLTRAIGPVASYIILETAQEMHMDLLVEDMESRAALIETIYSKIPDESLAMEFLNTITSWLRSQG